jgi:methyltransferase (TIGR00027 family)
MHWRRARQVVILGAGYDSRAYRFHDALSGRALVFEVDFPPTQEYKKLRVKELLGEVPPYVRWVPMDFNHDDLLTKLRESGYSESARTFFIWEGVTYYLPESGVRDTLRFVHVHSAPGSAIIFDYTDDRNPNLNNPTEFQSRVGEPMIFGFPPNSVGAFVRSEGLVPASQLSYDQLYDCYARRTDGSPAMPRPRTRTNLSGICIARVTGRPTQAGEGAGTHD